MKILSKIILYLGIIGLFLNPLVIFAQEEYNLLEPGVVGAAPDSKVSVSFVDYAENAYKIFLTIVVFVTVLMFIIGGLEYMTSALPAAKSNGIKRITAAFWGLVLALSSVLILNIINPDLLEIRVDFARVATNISEVPTTGGDTGGNNEGGGGPVGTSTPPTTGTSTTPVIPGEIRADLGRDPHIGINNPECPPNTPYQNVSGGCTSVEGLQASAVQGIKHIRQKVDADITITGGSELGHNSGPMSHGTGHKIDLGKNANSGQWDKITEVLKEATGQQSFNKNINYQGKLSNGQNIVVRYENPDHYDIKFP